MYPKSTPVAEVFGWTFHSPDSYEPSIAPLLLVEAAKDTPAACFPDEGCL